MPALLDRVDIGYGRVHRREGHGPGAHGTAAFTGKDSASLLGPGGRLAGSCESMRAARAQSGGRRNGGGMGCSKLLQSHTSLETSGENKDYLLCFKRLVC